MEITQLQAIVQLSFKQSQENTDALEGKCYYLVALKKKNKRMVIDSYVYIYDSKINCTRKRVRVYYTIIYFSFLYESLITARINLSLYLDSIGKTGESKESV